MQATDPPILHGSPAVAAPPSDGAPQPYAPPVFVRPERRALRALASDVGQGTVEYVGLLLLMASVLAAVVAASKGLGGEDQIGKKVVQQVGKSIDKAGEGGSSK